MSVSVYLCLSLGGCVDLTTYVSLTVNLTTISMQMDDSSNAVISGVIVQVRISCGDVPAASVPKRSMGSANDDTKARGTRWPMEQQSASLVLEYGRRCHRVGQSKIGPMEPTSRVLRLTLIP